MKYLVFDKILMVLLEIHMKKSINKIKKFLFKSQKVQVNISRETVTLWCLTVLSSEINFFANKYEFDLSILLATEDE